MELEQFEQQGYLVIDNFLPASLLEEVMLEFDHIKTQQLLKKASVGQGFKKQELTSVRGDFIFWLNNEHPEIPDTWNYIQEQVAEICQYFRIPTLTPELHFAQYPKGSRYKKHLDVFQQDSNRVLTFILYLNENYSKINGGELKMYLANGETPHIEPIANRAVFFWSNELAHEVLLTQSERKSLTGWFKRANVLTF